MTDQKFTRCPGCATVFRVTAAQLALREGQVRCGHCRAVFDANDHFVSLDAGPPPDEFDTSDELMMGRPTVTLRSADALTPVPQHGSARDEEPRDEPGVGERMAEGVRVTTSPAPDRGEAGLATARGAIARQRIGDEPTAGEPIAGEPGGGELSRDESTVHETPAPGGLMWDEPEAPQPLAGKPGPEALTTGPMTGEPGPEALPAGPITGEPSPEVLAAGPIAGEPGPEVLDGEPTTVRPAAMETWRHEDAADRPALREPALAVHEPGYAEASTDVDAATDVAAARSADGAGDGGFADEGNVVEEATVQRTADPSAAVARAGEATQDKAATAEGTTAEGTIAPRTGDLPGRPQATPEARSLPLKATAAAAPLATIDLPQSVRAHRFEWKKRGAGDGRNRAVYAVAASALLLGIALQAVLEYRDALAAHVPATRPLLAAVCGALGCTIDPPRDAAALSIDASDLQADPAHRGLLLLSATLRNRAGHAIAYPYLELTLTDSSDRIVARRAFAPAEYASAAADPTQGIPANGERVVRLFLDASATQQAGYRLYLFYP